jgi:hypothetical protein
MPVLTVRRRKTSPRPPGPWPPRRSCAAPSIHPSDRPQGAHVEFLIAVPVALMPGAFVFKMITREGCRTCCWRLQVSELGTHR